MFPKAGEDRANNLLPFGVTVAQQFLPNGVMVAPIPLEDLV
jgi:hypothetical protein